MTEGEEEDGRIDGGREEGKKERDDGARGPVREEVKSGCEASEP